MISLYINSDCKLESLLYLDSNIYWISSPCFHRVRPHDLYNSPFNIFYCNLGLSRRKDGERGKKVSKIKIVNDGACL